MPVYNDVENIYHVYSSLTPLLIKLQGNHEIIFIDDGSDDGTFKKLSYLAEKDEQVKVVRFRKNFGQSAALVAGFDFASGDVVISMDGDLQKTSYYTVNYIDTYLP